MSELPADLPDVQMVQCDITGRTVPLDETIELHGYRVCAEGKQILLDRLKAGETMPGELERPTVLRRFGAYFLDGLIFSAPTRIADEVAKGIASTTHDLGVYFVTVTLAHLCIVLAALSYFALLHAKTGQTVGKMAAKIKVVQLDGSGITMRQAWMRSLFFDGPKVLFAGIAFLVALLAAPSKTTQILIVGFLGFPMLYGLANIITALVDRQQQRAIHDYAAGTRVIRLP